MRVHLIWQCRRQGTLKEVSPGLQGKHQKLVQWSKPPPNDQQGRRSTAGAALLWKTELGKGEPLVASNGCKDDEHRACGRSWQDFESAYGDAQRANISWFAEVMRAARGGPRDTKPVLLLGYFNWKAAHDKLLCDRWSVVDKVCSVKKGAAAPTRCLYRGVSVTYGTQSDLLGVPHHRPTMYYADVPVQPPGQATRMRRSARYQWRTKPNWIEVERLRKVVDEEAPRCG